MYQRRCLSCLPFGYLTQCKPLASGGGKSRKNKLKKLTGKSKQAAYRLKEPAGGKRPACQPKRNADAPQGTTGHRKTAENIREPGKVRSTPLAGNRKEPEWYTEQGKYILPARSTDWQDRSGETNKAMKQPVAVRPVVLRLAAKLYCLFRNDNPGQN